MECGIDGLPGTGKTSLFNALTGSGVSLLGAGGKPHVANAEIPDPRLGVIASFVQTKKITPAVITFVDIPGIGAGHGAAKSGPVLAHIRQCDAICEVVRCFAEPIDPIRDINTLQDELILADMEVVESALKRARRPARTGDATAKARVAILDRVLPCLSDGKPARTITDWSPAERVILGGYGLISAKRVLYVANVAEDDLEGEAARLVHEHAKQNGGLAVTVCAKLEAELAELAELNPADREELLEGLGLAEAAIGPLARAVCELLGLAVFYTAGEQEIRAWTVADSAPAPEAAGVVHTDMQRGFIRAECYHVDDLVEHGTERDIKAAGKLRTEGKSYHVRDGDVIHYLFSN